MQGWLPELNKAVASMTPVAGKNAGDAFGKSFGAAAAGGVQAASAQMSSALDGVRAAAGRVKTAEAELNAVRSSGNATREQVRAAETKLSDARWAGTQASDRLHAATQNLNAAQANHTKILRDNSGAQAENQTRVTGLHTGMLNLSSAVNIAQGAFAAFSGVGRFLGGTIKAASDLNEEVNKSKVVFSTSAGEVINWSRTTATALGISQQQALASAGTFGNLFRAMGLAPKASADMSMGLVRLAADLASFNNANPADVLEAMRAGLVGEMEPMRRYGVDLSDVRLRQEAMNLGIYNGKGVLDSSQKAQAAYSLMLKQTTLAQGDFSRTSDGLANSQRILSAEWTNAKAQLGSALMPALIDVTHWLTGSVIPAFSSLVSFVQQNISWLGPLAVGIVGVVTAFKLVSAAVAAFDLAWKATTFGLIITVIVAVGVALYELWTRSETFRTIVTAAFNAVVAAGQWLWSGLQTVWGALQSAWNTLVTGIVYAWDNVLHPAWNVIATVFTWLWNTILFPLFTLWLNTWIAIVTGIVWAWDNVLHPAWNAIATVITWLWNTILMPIFGLIGAAWGAAMTAIAWGWTNVLQPAWTAVAAIAQWLWNTILGPIFGFVVAAWNAMTTAIVWAWDNILHPVWNVIAAIAEVLFKIAVVVIFGLVKLAWEAMVIGIQFIWDNVLHPLWNLVATVATWLWEVVLKNIFTLIAWGWENLLVRPLEFIWNNVLHPVWDAVATIATWLWNNILSPIFTAIAWGWENLLVRPVEWVWNNVLHPVWQAVADTAGWLWNNILHPIFDAIGVAWDGLMRAVRWVYDTVVHPMWTIFSDALGALQRTFGTVVDGIKATWDRIQDIAKAPINFVIRTVLRDGLFKAWNAVVDWLGLGSWRIDTNAAWLQGIAYGGPVQGFSPTTRSDNIPAALTAGEYVQPVDTHSYYGTEAMNAVRERRATIAFAAGGAVPGTGAMTWGNLWQIAQKMFPGVLLNDAYRPGANDYHGSGQAVDLGWGGNNRAQLDRISAGIAQAFPYSTELIHNPNGSIKDGRPVPPSFWGAATWAAHMTHVHWAMTQAAMAAGGGPGSGSLFAAIGDVLNSLNGGISKVADMVGTFGNSPFVNVIKAVPAKLLGIMWDKVKGPAQAAIDAAAAAFGVDTGQTYPQTTPGTAGLKQQAFQIASTFGWNAVQQQQNLDFIATKESGWNPTAQNPVSSASGIWQMIDSTWNAYKNAGPWPKARNAPPAEQDVAAFRYIRQRYGDPLTAGNYWRAHNNYDRGGVMGPGEHGGNRTRWDERVLSPRQTEDFHRLVVALEGRHHGHDRRSDRAIDTVNVYAADRDQGVEIVDKLWHRLKVARRGGVYPTATVFV